MAELKRWKIKETFHWCVEFIIAEDGIVEDFKVTNKWSTRNKPQEWTPRNAFFELEEKIKKQAKRKVTRKKATKEVESTVDEEVML